MKTRGSSRPGKLTAISIRGIKRPGYHADGGNLYLRVSSDGNKSWAFIYTVRGKTREMGLGRTYDVTLEAARHKASEARLQLAEGRDPIEERRSRLERLRIETMNRITFDDAARRYIASHKAGWKNAKHKQQWENTLATYARPVIGELWVHDVTMHHVLRVLEPIWTSKAETASRLRQRIEKVLDWAKGRGFRTGDNPAAWRGNLDAQLPSPAKVSRVTHHPAVPIDRMPAFFAALREKDGMSALALQFTILCAVRTNETIGATWDEVNLETGVWSIPAARMKMERDHRVPLPPRAVEILKALPHREGYLFLGAKKGKPLSSMSMLQLARGMGAKDDAGNTATVHGFRSTFKDWAAERTNFPREVSEMALAHAISNDVEAAYRRGDLFAKRSKLMQAWDAFCCSGATAAKVTPMARKKAA